MTGNRTACWSARPRVWAGRAPAPCSLTLPTGWTDPESPRSLPCADAVKSATLVLRTACGHGFPAVFTTAAYDEDELESVHLLRKTPRVRRMGIGSPLTAIGTRLAPAEGEFVLVKKRASAVFDIGLDLYLSACDLDTLLISGCITSGCVRASAVDAARHGFRALVVAEACADRMPEAHEATLGSVDELYGDVVALAEAEAALERAWA
jgi:maleamate amidohydrolase